MWCIYELVSAKFGNYYRYVAMFETPEDAKIVLDVLEDVQDHFNVYELVQLSPIESEIDYDELFNPDTDFTEEEAEQWNEENEEEDDNPINWN